MAVSLAALGIGAGIAIYGAVKQNQAKKAAQANQRPHYDIPQEEYDNLRLAEANANQGESDASRQYMQNQADRGLAAGIAGINRSGGDPNAIGSLYDRYSNGVNQNAIYDDQVRLNNLRNLQNAYTRMSANKDKDWQVNRYGPYADKAQAIAQQLAGAQNTTMSGVNIMGQGITGLAAKRPGTNINVTQQQQSGIDTSANYGDGGFINYNAPVESAGGASSMPNYIDADAPAGKLYSDAWSNNSLVVPGASASYMDAPGASGNFNMAAASAPQGVAPVNPNAGSYQWNGFYPVQNP